MFHPLQSLLRFVPPIVTLLVFIFAFSTTAAAENNAASHPKPLAELHPLNLYQRFISGADGQRCPMTPSCSEYARQAFQQYGLLKGWILTCDRLLRCGRDERQLAVQHQGAAYDPLQANTFWWDKNDIR